MGISFIEIQPLHSGGRIVTPSRPPVAQVTDRMAPENEPLQPVGNVKPELIVKVTAPPNPLIEVTDTVEVPATVARVVIGGPAIEKSRTWKVAVFEVILCGVPVTVTV